MIKLRQLILILFIMVMPFFSYAEKMENGKRFRALVIGIDGAKGVPFNQCVFIDNKAPNLKNIAEQGGFTACTYVDDEDCAHTHLGPRFHSDYSWVTAPGWGTVLTGVNNNKHFIKNNDYTGLEKFASTAPFYPTFLSQLKSNGFIVAAGGVGSFLTSDNKGKNASLSLGVLDFECGLNRKKQTSAVMFNAKSSCNLNYRESLNGHDPERDIKLTAWLLSMINKTGNRAPDLIMGVFDTLDAAGHRYGYSANVGYMNALSTIDGYIGQLMQAVQRRAATANEAWLVIVTSDHGGHVNAEGSGSHGKGLRDDEVIPFIVAIVGDRIKLVNPGNMTNQHVNQMDVNPTVLYWFDVKRAKVDGVVRSQYQWQ